jgi:glucose 1-dehydrogenase
MILEDQVAIVTGGGQGIGKAIALRCALEGADIAVLDINEDTAEATTREILDSGRRALVKVADVSDPEAVSTAVDEVVNELQRVDVLINNAGIEKRAEFLEITPEDWQCQLDVNLSGTFYLHTGCGATDEQTRLWTHREHLFSGRAHRSNRSCCLRRGEGGDRRAHSRRRA